MTRILSFLFLIIVMGCSFTATSFWTKDEKIKEVKKNKTKIFRDAKVVKKEFNQNILINLGEIKEFNQEQNDLTNNLTIIDKNYDLKKRSKYRFSKIDDFDYFEPEINFDGKNFIFFNDKGTLLKFDNNFKTIWKKNYYSNQEKKLKPILTFANDNKVLVVYDSIAKFYAINLKTGDLVWSRVIKNPSNSQMKILKDRIFLIDLNNILRCFSIKDGSEIWTFKSENTFLKSAKRNSLVIKKNTIYMNNSLGDISAIDADQGTLLWQIPTQSSEIYENAFNLTMSDLVAKNDDLIFSNNKNQFYSINLVNGVVNWKQEINSSVRPVFIENLILTISNEGYLFVIDSNSGNIIRVTDIFGVFKNKKREKIKPVGFIMSYKEILLSTNTGKLLIIDISTGKTKKILKIDNGKISRPFIFDKKILLLTDKSIIKLN